MFFLVLGEHKMEEHLCLTLGFSWITIRFFKISLYAHISIISYKNQKLHYKSRKTNTIPVKFFNGGANLCRKI